MESGVLRRHHLASLNDILQLADQPRLIIQSCTSTLELRISWCSSTLRWQVLAPWPGLGSSPDIICEDDGNFNPLAEAASDSSAACTQLRCLLQNWDPEHKDAVHQLLTLLLRAFCDHQIRQLHQINNDRLQFELSTLPHSPDLEALLISDSRTGQKASFAIPLESLDLSKIQPLLQQPTPGTLTSTCTPAQQSAPEQGPAPHPSAFKLEITFPLAAMESPQLSLRVPRALKHLVQAPQLPSWSRQSCLMEYVPLVVERVQQQLDSVAARLATRSQVVEALTEVLGAPVEVNQEGLVVCWQVAWEGSFLLLFLDLGPGFPDDPPGVTLHSLRHLGGPGAQLQLKNVPWSPRWSPREMAGRIFNFVKEQIPPMISGLPPL